MRDYRIRLAFCLLIVFTLAACETTPEVSEAVAFDHEQYACKLYVASDPINAIEMYLDIYDGRLVTEIIHKGQIQLDLVEETIHARKWAVELPAGKYVDVFLDKNTHKAVIDVNGHVARGPCQEI